MKKKILLSAFLILFASCLFGQTVENQLERTPSKIKEIDAEKAVVEFKTDISNVEVYLNGCFYGRTNLEITDLLPGSYLVDLELAGYESQQFFIQVKKGFAQVYSFEMKLIQGTITLFNLPEGAQVTLDEKEIISDYKKDDSGVIYTVPGEHKIGIRCFGFEDFEQKIKVEGNQDSSIQLELVPAVFVLSDFKATKATFNPDYKGRLGSCIFTYKVSKNAFVTAEVFDSNNQLVWTDTFRDFETWEQSFSWDGKTSDGKNLENGTYLVKLSSQNFEESASVTISRSIDYPLFNANATGSGVGPLPAVFGSRFDYCSVYLNVTPTTALSLKESSEKSKNYFYGLGLSAGIIWDFADHFELSGNAYTMPGHEKIFVGRIGGSFKISDYIKFDNGLIFSYGGLIRLGFATNAVYEPYGIDNGSGLGAGGLLSLSKDKWNVGFSTQFIWSAATGSLKNKDWGCKNAITGSFKPVKALSLNGWAGLNSSLSGVAVNYGAGLTWIPFSSTILINLNIDGNFAPGEMNYLSTQFGLSYLF